MTDGPAVDTPPPPDETPDLRAALAEREAEVAALNARLAASQARLAQASEARLRAAVLEACARAGVRDLSRTDVCRAAREVFTLSDGLEVVALPGVEAPGGLDGWLAGLRRTGAAAWWEVAAGAGAPPARVPADPPNPFARDTLDLTEQGRLLRSQPDLAARLRERAR